jgi:hypothetical protein
VGILLAASAALALGVGSAGSRAVSVGEAIIGAGAGGSGVPIDGEYAPTAAARAEIPQDYLAQYVRAGAEMDLDWRFLAAIGAQESDHGRHPATARVNRSGCVGPMQLGVRAPCGDFVGAYGRDGDGDGRVNPRAPEDAIQTAAYGLRVGKGAPAVGGEFEQYRLAACRYYGACSTPGTDYARQVMARAVRYGLDPA